MTCGIYLLGFEGTHKVYVGQSLTIESRFTEHCKALKDKCHTPKLNEAYALYGLPSLEILEICTRDQLPKLEVYHITLWEAVSDGYNYISQVGCPSEGHPKGEDLGKTLYTNETIIKVVEYIISNPDMPLNLVSTNFGIKYGVLKGLTCGDSYKWLANEIPESYIALMALKGNRTSQGLTNYTVDQIYTTFKVLLEDVNVSTKVVAEKCNVSTHVVYNIRSGKSYSWIQTRYPEENALLREKIKATLGSGTSAKSQRITYPPVVSPIDGKVYYIENAAKFAREHSLNSSNFSALLNGNAKTHKGWRLAPTIKN